MCYLEAMTIATIWMILSGVLGALSNLCMRKSMDKKGSVRVFFLFQLFFTFLVVTCMHPIRTGSYSINFYTIAVGIACGIALGLLKYMIRYALKKGPASLTFASVNSASVAPGIITALFLGTTLEYPYQMRHFLGSLLVVIGLFWAIKDQTKFLQKRKWLVFACIAFCIQTLYLCMTQWHGIIIKNTHLVSDMWKRGSQELHSEWFIPITFATATILHVLIYSLTERRIPIKWEVMWGTCGGLLNGACTFFSCKALCKPPAPKAPSSFLSFL